jgi:hypothetical protein
VVGAGMDMEVGGKVSETAKKANKKYNKQNKVSALSQPLSQGNIIYKKKNKKKTLNCHIRYIQNE